jgi:hypothetical protein
METHGIISPHDQARARTYRWGEDGLGGICDRWNERDPILKERLFGLTNSEGQVGEERIGDLELAQTVAGSRR